MASSSHVEEITIIIPARHLERIFNIQPAEQRKAALVFGYAILLFSAGVLADTASLGIFFEAYDAAALPYTFVLLMVIGPLVSFFYLRLNSKLTLSQALLSVHFFLLLSLILLPLLLKRSDAPVVRFLLPVYVDVNVILTYTSFWNLLGRIYNLRQGKRLFPVLSSAEHVAAITAGFMATFFIARFGPTNMFWIGALLMGGATVLLLIINRAEDDKMGDNPGDEAAVRSPSHLRTLVKQPYVRLLFAVVIFYTLGAYMVDYLAFAVAEIRFPTAEQMATYVALFMGIYGVLGLTVQWLIAGRFLDRFGVSTALLALPGGLFILVALFALIGGFNEAAMALFWLSSGANMYAYTFDAFYTGSKNVMLQPLPAHMRTQVQTTSMGIVYPLATGLSGLLLLFLLNVLGFDSVQLSLAILVVLALWLVVGARLSRAYLRRLRQALQASIFGRPGLFSSLDRNTMGVLTEALSSPHPAAVLFAMDRLAEVAPEALPGRLPALLAYPDDSVRLAALRRIRALAWREKPAAVTALLVESDNPEVRAAALKTWYALDPVEAGASLGEYAHDAQVPVRQAALVLMVRHQDAALGQQALESIGQLVRSPSPAERILASAVIGQVEAADSVEHLLLKLLADGEPTVQHAALKAAGRLCLPASWPVILPLLARGKTRSLAAGALVCAGEKVLPLLQASCQVQGKDPAMVAAIALVCGRIDSPMAFEILVALLDHPDATVRREAFLGLGRNAYQAPPDQREAFKERLRSQAKRLAAIVAAQVDVQAAGADKDVPSVFLMADALEQRRQIETDNLLLLLSFLAEPETVLSVREVLQRGRSGDEKRAYALETLDILLDHGDKRLTFPFLLYMGPEQRLSNLPEGISPRLLGRAGRLIRLLSVEEGGNERWTRICAIYTLGLLGIKEARNGIIDTAAHFEADSVLVETAINSLEQLGLPLEEIVSANPALEHAVEQWQKREPASLTLLQKAESLKRIDIFAPLPSDALEAIGGSMQVVALGAEETIIKKGTLGDRLYIILDGQLGVHEHGRMFETLKAGDIVGEMALLDARPRSASVTAMTEAHLLELAQEPFFDLLAADPHVARELLALLSRRLRDRMADVAHASPEAVMRSGVNFAGGKKGIGMAGVVPGTLESLDRLFILKGTDLFGELDDNLLAQVAGLLEEINLTGGETLFHTGDPGHSLYIVAMGQLRVHIAERTLDYQGEGSVIGEMALLDSEPRSASVTTAVPSQLLRLDQAPFFELMELQPALSRAMIRMVSGRLRARMQELTR